MGGGGGVGEGRGERLRFGASVQHTILFTTIV